MSKSHDLKISEWVVTKRDGTVVPFDYEKIRKALYRCFNSVRPDAEMYELERIVNIIGRTVVNIIRPQIEKTKFGVEDVQRIVIQQLWSHELFDEAEHYQNYREEHRKARATAAVTPEVRERFGEMQQHFPTDLQIYQLMSKFSRWREGDRRRETWKELVTERVCPWLFKQVPDRLTVTERKELTDAMYDMEVSPAMRVVQMAGPALDRCNVGAYNCAYHPITDRRAFSELLYILMQGTGAGFSVEDEYISKLPRVERFTGQTTTFVVEDTTEGWCDALDGALDCLWNGIDVHFDVSKVRKKGSRLKTKGGRASGPEPLLELIAFVRNVFKARQGKRLRDIDVHDICCMIGKIVQVGGVRRAAEISLSDLDSRTMRDCKSGNWYDTNVQRTMANNSAVYEEKPSIDDFTEEWLALMKSKSGERGIFNRQSAYHWSPVRRKWGHRKPGGNPCLEILLRPFEFCNLTIVVARPWDTIDSLKRKVRLATIFGKIQSMCTNFQYIRKEWKNNCEEERLLGVDITGHADCPLLRHDNPDRAKLLVQLNDIVRATDIEFSIRFGCNESAANTTVKPGGDSAVFFDCASGVSARFSDYQIRWVRETKDSPVAKFLVASGVPNAPAPEAPDSLLVFGFPKRAPQGAVTRNQMTAKEQFYNWLEWKTCWAEHSVSATIYVEDHEWLELGHLVYSHFDKITGLSFLPKDNGVYTFAPNEELTKEKYEEFLGKFPDLDWATLTAFESEDMTESSQTFACVGDKC